MKRTAVVCLAVLCAAALGPEARASGKSIKAGFSLARIHESSTAPLPFKWSGLTFVTGGLGFESGLGLGTLQLEFLYVQMGGKFDADASNGLTNRYHYIQIPVQLKVSLMPTGPLRPFVAAGGYGAYLVRAESAIKVDGVTTKAKVTADYDRWDWGVLGSAGLAFKLPVLTVTVEARYNFGLANILASPVAGDTIKNRCWMALVGLSY